MQDEADPSELFEKRHFFRRWIVRVYNVVRQGNLEKAVEWMSDLVLQAR